MGAAAQQASNVGGISAILIPIILLGVAKIFVLPYIPANIARKKGYGFMGFYILGLFFFLIALIVSLCLSDKKEQLAEMKKVIHSEKVSPSVADELKKYKELLEQGTISQEEFDDIKKKLIVMWSK